MVVLSIDHGARSGYSIFEGNEYVESGVVTLNSVTSLRQAQVEFYQIFSFYKPKILVVEKVNVTGNKFGIEHFITTQRTDRTGISRDELPQNSLVNHECEANAQALITISRKRLCHCASPETRQAWQKAKNEIALVEPELASVMVKECVYRNGLCPEMFTCGYNKTKLFE